MQQGTEPLRYQARRQRVAYRGKGPVGVILLLVVLFLGSLAYVLLLLSGVTPFEEGEPLVLDAKSTVLGEWQEMMVEMLDPQLPFTIFVPSEEAFSRVLKSATEGAAGSGGSQGLNASVAVEPGLALLGAHNASSRSLKVFGGMSRSLLGKDVEEDEESDAINAVVSRLLAFGSIPSRILVDSMAFGRESVWESISGYLVYVIRDAANGLVANNMSCQATDILRGSNVIHVLDGVLMDPEFEQAVTTENEEF